MTPLQIGLLKQAASQPDGTVLTIGYNRHDPSGSMKSYPTLTAISLKKRGFVKFLKVSAGFSVYQITDTGRQYLSSLTSPRTIFIAVWSSHNTKSEGGRKTHLALKRGGFKTLCGRLERLGLQRSVGSHDITDIDTWLEGGLGEVCTFCVKSARKMK